jgi:hypothetical protein
VPREWETVGACELDHPHRRPRRARADDLEADALDALERFPTGNERGQDDVAERSVVEQNRAERVATDRNVAKRLRNDSGEEDGLAGEKIHLPQEAGGAVAYDLVSGGIEDRNLALHDRDEWIGRVSYPEENITDRSRALFAKRSQGGELRFRQ